MEKDFKEYIKFDVGKNPKNNMNLEEIINERILNVYTINTGARFVDKNDFFAYFTQEKTDEEIKKIVEKFELYSMIPVSNEEVVKACKEYKLVARLIPMLAKEMMTVKNGHRDPGGDNPQDMKIEIRTNEKKAKNEPEPERTNGIFEPGRPRRPKPDILTGSKDKKQELER